MPDLTDEFVKFMEQTYNVRFVDVTPDPVCKCGHSIFLHAEFDYEGMIPCCECTNFEKMEVVDDHVDDTRGCDDSDTT